MFKALYTRPGYPDVWRQHKSAQVLIKTNHAGEGYVFTTLYQWHTSELTYNEEQQRWVPGPRPWYVVARNLKAQQPLQKTA